MNKWLVALVVSAFFGGAAMAADAPSFETLDQDGNGTISAEEAKAAPNLADAWNKADSNEDGVVDRAEFSAFETMEMQQKQQKGDSDM